MDVSYSAEEKKASTEETKDDANSSLLEEIKEKEDELTYLSFQCNVLKNQKKMVQKYARNVTEFQSGNKVHLL